jgi:hypothetical protein
MCNSKNLYDKEACGMSNASNNSKNLENEEASISTAGQAYSSMNHYVVEVISKLLCNYCIAFNVGSEAKSFQIFKTVASPHAKPRKFNLMMNYD